LSRGRAELDEGALADAPVLEVKLRDVRLGQTIQVDDAKLGVWRGKVTGVSHQIDVDDEGNLSASTSINLRKPR
jgi:pyruvate kinase